MMRESRSDESGAAGWWQTLPGMLAATAGVITAATGLLVALNQVGWLGGGTDPDPSVLADEASPGTAPPYVDRAPAGDARAALRGPGTAPPFRVVLPPEPEIRLRSTRGEGTYRLLDARLEQRTADRLVMTIAVRLTNSGPLDIGFWSDSFRLSIDGVPRAPVNSLIGAVDARSAEEGEVVFEVPTAAKSLLLEIANGEDAATIPLAIVPER